MPDSPSDLDQPEQRCSEPPRRVVADWEYKTAYIPGFQVRVTAGLHNRLCEWAKQERKPLGALLVEILEEAVCRHGS
jgi:predicted HicB family RNase H-like nuclease